VSEAAPSQNLRIGVTLGDPRGVGPELAAAAARSFRAVAAHHILFIGPGGTGAEAAADDFISVGHWQKDPPRPAGHDAPSAHRASHPDAVAAAGRLAGLAIDAGIRLALDGDIDALVTAPIDKFALHAGGYHFPGHTEMLASRCAVDDVVMMLAAERTAVGGALRVILATTHIPLADVPRALDADRLISQTRATVKGLRDGWDLPAPRIALCAFNPHASDGGRFGDEEARIYEPAMTVLRGEGVDVAGPVPADTVFLRAARGEFDAVIAPYHDVGMAAFKTVAFGSGVNVTLGLPFPRTSPDHGTALDIAGTGSADPASMLEAFMLAARLGAVRRNRSTAALT
jgi:4-hydroxythreonine-4-phosphate dehydrogenase